MNAFTTMSFPQAAAMKHVHRDEFCVLSLINNGEGGNDMAECVKESAEHERRGL